jgi:hypothetical protein
LTDQDLAQPRRQFGGGRTAKLLRVPVRLQQRLLDDVRFPQPAAQERAAKGTGEQQQVVTISRQGQWFVRHLPSYSLRHRHVPICARIRPEPEEGHPDPFLLDLFKARGTDAFRPHRRAGRATGIGYKGAGFRVNAPGHQERRLRCAGGRRTGRHDADRRRCEKLQRIRNSRPIRAGPARA